MPNLYTLQTRYKEIAGLLEKAVDDNEKGRITNKQFVDIASPLNAEAREIGDTLKAYNSLPRSCAVMEACTELVAVILPA